MRIPSSTYRVQFNLNFRFADAEALVPYLHQLGISDLYASPRFKARRGSSHGYDVADPMRINSELGTEEEFDRLVARLHQYGMGLLLDIVPNHMAASEENPWWMDVLENGRESPYANFFDIDWEPRGIKIADLERDRVVLPILAEPYAELLRKGAIRLRFDDRGFSFQYEDHRLPLNPRDYEDVLQVGARTLGVSSDSARAQFEKLHSLSQRISKSEADQTSPSEGRKTTFELKMTLWQLYQQNDSALHRAIDEGLRILNGNSENPTRSGPLHALLSRQVYRLAHWKLASSEINYRRFFDINDLVGLRTEDPLVFAARHSSLIQLLQEGKVSGLRVDHIDGLWDPLEYLKRLNSIPVAADKQPSESLNVYTVVEKIICGREMLPPEWEVMGTTGYDFLNASNALFVDPQGYREIEESYRRFAGTHESFSDVWYRSKREAIETTFAADLELLAYRLGRIAALVPEGADIPVPELIAGLKEITACLPVYRTYYREDAVLSEQDKSALEKAMSDAQRRFSEKISESAFTFLKEVFWAELPLDDSEIRKAWVSFITRWQQFTGGVMAKGLEDTALFRHHSLISINEVGNNPFHEQIRFEPCALHEFNCDASHCRQHTMNATSTHDTKWSEDVRARVNVLSEMPREWSRHLRRWSTMNTRHKTTVDGKHVPTPNEEVLFYQAMLGIWPLVPFSEIDKQSLESRLEEFLVKAAKEAKTETSWLSPNEKHESALRKFVSSLLAVSLGDPFFIDFLKLHREVAFLGACNSCSQLVLKITGPGVPDFYQGNELWNPCLTDPDNRRAVDFRIRMVALEQLGRDRESGEMWLSVLLDNWADGYLKLHLTSCLLNFRRSHHEFFSHASYIPLSVRGVHDQSVFAFARGLGDEWLMVLVPRLLRGLAQPGQFPLWEVWSTTAIELPHSFPIEWQDVLTGQRIDLRTEGEPEAARVSTFFRHLPFAVLWSNPA
jgi:(1->4)-alpha-D-glucan 1-alpha-D-glucosylmutase